MRVRRRWASPKIEKDGASRLFCFRSSDFRLDKLLVIFAGFVRTLILCNAVPLFRFLTIVLLARKRSNFVHFPAAFFTVHSGGHVFRALFGTFWYLGTFEANSDQVVEDILDCRFVYPCNIQWWRGSG